MNRDRIMSVVERDASLLADAGPSARWRRWSVLNGSRLALGAAAALAACLLAGFVIAGLGGDQQTYRATVDPALAPVASAEIRVNDGEATLVADGLPRPPGAYQVWIMPRGSDEPEPSVLFLPRDGSATAAAPGVEDATAVLVTREPKSGSSVPSEKPLMTVNMS